MIWLKTMGIALIISGFGSYGLMGAKRIEMRVNQIKSIRLSMGFLEKEISYMHSPLSVALARTAQFTPAPVKVLFNVSSLRLKDRQGATAAEAWNEGLNEIAHCSALLPEDIELLRSVASQLGVSSSEEQKKFFRLIAEELKIQEEKAQRGVESGSKLWAYGGFIMGATVVLLLL